uniref:Solute carrier family 8 member B1 n=1 Tax=Amazona collaria TaxID=241587 RepID=A0A8B9G9E8_9PSIT
AAPRWVRRADSDRRCPLVEGGGVGTLGACLSPPCSAPQCWEVRKHNSSEWCRFIRSNPDCRLDGGFLNYLEGVFCTFPPRLLPLAVTLYALWLLYLFVILGVTAEKFAVVAFSNPRTAGLAIGAVFGAGVFVTTVVAGGIALVKPFTAASRPFLRDVIFYMLAVFLTFLGLYFGRITLGEALGYLGLYIFYVLTVVLCTWIHRWQRGDGTEMPTDTEEPESSGTNSGDYGEEYRPLLPSREPSLRILTTALSPLDCHKWRRKPWYWRLFKVLKVPVELVLLLTVPVVDPDKDDLNWKRPLNCLHIVTSLLLCILTLKSGTYGLYQIQGIFPVWGLVTLVGSVLAIIIFITTSNEEPPKYHCVFAFLGFLASAMWINAAATELVNILRTLGIIFQLSNTVLGLTLLAWGNSIGGEGSAVPQCHPMSSHPPGKHQDILVGVGLGCLLQMTSSQLVVKLEPDSLLVWVLAGALGLSLVFSFVWVPAQCFQLGKAYGICLILYYLAFLCVALLTEFRVIRLSAV